MTGRELPPELGIEHNWEKHFELGTNDIFVEVGGFWGRYAAYASPRCSRVFMVEPNPENHKKIQERNLSNVTIIPKAVSDHNGTQKFLDSGNPSGTRLANNEGDAASFPNAITVETDTLEGILNGLGISHVDLLASDCEGCEINLLKHAGKWLYDGLVHHWAIGAYHHPENPMRLAATFNAHGYTCSYEDGTVLYASR